jgi:hypothetical protein
LNSLEKENKQEEKKNAVTKPNAAGTFLGSIT